MHRFFAEGESMICCWDELMNLFPPGLRAGIQSAYRPDIKEIRLRLGAPPSLSGTFGIASVDSAAIDGRQLTEILNRAVRYSVYAVESWQEGYLTVAGGHRIGFCGLCRKETYSVSNLSNVTSLCIRIARDVPNAAEGIDMPCDGGSVLILGPPGSGKTTLLRDLVRRIGCSGQAVSVVDERCELFPRWNNHWLFPNSCGADVLQGTTKSFGIERMLRTMSPQWIAVDEITSETDCAAIQKAGYSGVRFLATCHAWNTQDLKRRPIYRELIKTEMFTAAVVLDNANHFTMEEIKP